MSSEKGDLKIIDFNRKNNDERVEENYNKILKDLKLDILYKAVFVKNTPETVQQLKLIDNYIVYGFPTRKTVSELIKRKGFLKVGEKTLPMSDNNMIEEAFGSLGIICLDDIVSMIMKN